VLERVPERQGTAGDPEVDEEAPETLAVVVESDAERSAVVAGAGILNAFRFRSAVFHRWQEFRDMNGTVEGIEELPSRGVQRDSSSSVIARAMRVRREGVIRRQLPCSARSTSNQHPGR
jgi:hypothetical protein